MEGAYTRRMVAAPDTGGDIVSAVWAFVMVGALGASGLVGAVARGDAALFWWVATPFAAQVVVPVAAGWLGEDRSARGLRGRAIVCAHREVFEVGALVAAGAVGLAAASLWGSPAVQAAVSISTSAALCGVSLWLLPPLMGTFPPFFLVRQALWGGEGAGTTPRAAGSLRCDAGRRGLADGWGEGRQRGGLRAWGEGGGGGGALGRDNHPGG